MTTALRCARATLQHRVDVLQIAEGHDAGEIAAGHRQHDRLRAGREQQPVVRSLDAAARAHDAAHAVDRDDRIAGVQRDAFLAVPLERIEDDVVDALLAREHRRQQDAVVVADAARRRTR